MPFIAIPVAVIAIGVAAVEVAAATAITIGVVASVAAAVGATVAAVGMVTGSKELQIAGTILGVVGGVAGLANSAGLFGTAADGLGVVGGAADEAGWAMTDWGLSAGADAGVAPLASETAGAASTEAGINLSGIASGHQADTLGVVSGIGDAPRAGLTDALGNTPADIGAVKPPDATPTPTPAAAVDTTAASGTNVTSTVDPAAASTGVATPTPPTTAAPAAPAAPSILSSLDAGVPGSAAAAQAAASSAGPITVPDAGGGVFSDILGLIGKPGMSTLLAGTLQAGGAFIGGALKTDYAGHLTPAQVNALNAQAEANIAAANLQRRQLEIQSQPMPGVTNSGVQITPRPPGNGLINQPRPAPINQQAVTGQPAVPITGAPA